MRAGKPEKEEQIRCWSTNKEHVPGYGQRSTQMSAYSGVDLLLAGAAGPIVTLTLIRLMVAFAPRIGLVDLPDARKIHNGPVPLVGGIALVLAYLASASLML